MCVHTLIKHILVAEYDHFSVSQSICICFCELTIVEALGSRAHASGQPCWEVQEHSCRHVPSSLGLQSLRRYHTSCTCNIVKIWDITIKVHYWMLYSVPCSSKGTVSAPSGCLHVLAYLLGGFQHQSVANASQASCCACAAGRGRFALAVLLMTVTKAACTAMYFRSPLATCSTE